MTAWLLLALAIATEVAGTVALRHTDGFRRPGPSALVLVAYSVAIYLLAVVVRRIPVSVTYAVWSGAGTALVAVIGMLVLHERVTVPKIVCLALVVVGVIGLNLFGTE